jgi:hypothetical protein
MFNYLKNSLYNAISSRNNGPEVNDDNTVFQNEVRRKGSQNNNKRGKSSNSANVIVDNTGPNVAKQNNNSNRYDGNDDRYDGNDDDRYDSDDTDDDNNRQIGRKDKSNRRKSSYEAKTMFDAEIVRAILSDFRINDTLEGTARNKDYLSRDKLVAKHHVKAKDIQNIRAFFDSNLSVSNIVEQLIEKRLLMMLLKRQAKLTKKKKRLPYVRILIGIRMQTLFQLIV